MADPATLMTVMVGGQLLQGGLNAAGSLAAGEATAEDIKAQRRQEGAAAGREQFDIEVQARRQVAAARAASAVGGSNPAALIGQALLEGNLGQRRVGADFMTAHRALSVRGANVKSAARLGAVNSVLGGAGGAAGAYAQGRMWQASMDQRARGLV